MSQRRPRLGDILDDYCPRERRITNHAVVAMIEDEIKQTRCTTCDAEHEYKHAKVPAARKRKAGALTAAHLVEGSSRAPAAAEESHDDVPEADIPLIADEVIESESEDRRASLSGAPEEHAEIAAAPEAEAAEAVLEPEAGEEEGANESDNWPVHRPLIRAQLPRPEGHVPERKEPDFTFRPGGKFDPNRNGRHRGGHRPMRHGQGGQSSGQGQRFGGPRSGQGPRGTGQGGPQGQRQGNRPGQGGGRPGQGQGQGQGRGPRPGGGRKRGR